MNFREYGLHDEVKRQMEFDEKVFVHDPFDSSINAKVERKVHRRDDQWMVKVNGYWCELTGWKFDNHEHPRTVSFRVDIREKYV